MSTVLTRFLLKPVVPYRIHNQRNLPNTNPIMGVELELENVMDWEEWLTPAFSRKEDNSLRNNGSEFVSFPMYCDELVQSIEDFYKKNKINNSNISERCSTHVHLNVQDLTLEQVAGLCQVYQVLEHVLFNFVGDDRASNIFCVPWCQTQLLSRPFFKAPYVPQAFKTWQKYTALNLLPLFNYGTIEFRHLAGQVDPSKISQWISLIKAMYFFVRNNDLVEIENRLLGLNTTSQYESLINVVFQENASILKQGNYETLLEEGVLALKYMMFDNCTGKNNLVLERI